MGKNLLSKTFSFTDINYAVASHEDKEKMFLGYSEILNSLDSGATAKITINNRRIQKSKFEKTNMIPLIIIIANYINKERTNWWFSLGYIVGFIYHNY